MALALLLLTQARRALAILAAQAPHPLTSLPSRHCSTWLQQPRILCLAS
jgi:hypothetical protein